MQRSFFPSCFSLSFLLNILLIMGTSSNHVYVSLNETNREGVSEMFKEFVEVHNRTYVNDPEEYGRRLNIFKKSLARHAKLNAREKELKGTAVYGVNQFSDWTPQEFREFLRRGSRTDLDLQLTNTLQNTVEECLKHTCVSFKLNASATPKRQDWNKKGKVTAVKNQGECGSCWAFTATECIETQWAIANNPLTKLSVQEFISCSTNNKGCKGGNTFQAFVWLQGQNYTLAPDSEFPYEDRETTCKTNLLKEKGAKISCGCLLFNKTEDPNMKQLVGLHGPLAVNVDATMWHDYLGGIIQHHCTDTDINHAVQITGYDFNEHISYWIVRNSWGSSFGDNGYLYIKMGDNLCGVADSPTFVII